MIDHSWRWQQVQIHDLLLTSADKTPDAPMVHENGTWHSYAAICSIARHVACHLVEKVGATPGSRVAVFWENSAAAIAASFGVWIAGCVLVPINTDMKGDDLVYQIEHSDSVAVIVGRKQMRHLLAIAANLSAVASIVADGPLPPATSISASCVAWQKVAESGDEMAEPVRSIDIDLAAIVYTSGSTGRPKGVMLTHLNLVSNTRSIVQYLKLSSRDSVMMILPHFYIYGLSLILTHTMVGGAVVLDNRFMYPNTVLDAMVQTQVTGFAGVPSTFSILLARSVVREKEFPSLRYVTQAGGGMPIAVQQEVAAAFAPAELFIMYGATEASPRLSYLEPSLLSEKWGSIGKAVPNVEVLVADETGNRLPAGTEGEIAARGANITSGYWKDPEASKSVLRNGLYFTGDLGTMDAEGFIYVTGRAKDILKVKGFRVSPAEIEEHIADMEGVRQAAVIGVPDQVLGEAPVAYLELSDSTVAADTIRAHLQRELPPYKVPIDYVVVDNLPKNAAGKIQKTVLRDQYQGLSDE